MGEGKEGGGGRGEGRGGQGERRGRGGVKGKATISADPWSRRNVLIGPSFWYHCRHHRTAAVPKPLDPDPDSSQLGRRLPSHLPLFSLLLRLPFFFSSFFFFAAALDWRWGGGMSRADDSKVHFDFFALKQTGGGGVPTMDRVRTAAEPAQAVGG